MHLPQKMFWKNDYMSELKNQSVKTFLQELSSASPTPGGGTVAAFGASIAASLIAMVASLTKDKKGYEKVSGRMKRILPIVIKQQQLLLQLADEDAQAFNKVMAAYKLPKEEKGRKEAIQKALKYAVEVPLKVEKISDELIVLAKEVRKNGNKNAYSDAKSAEYFAKAAKKAAVENIILNLASITDTKWKQRKGLQ